MLAVLPLVLSDMGQAKAGTTNLGTAGNAASWEITGGGAAGATAFQVDVTQAGQIAPTSNGKSSGSFASGGSLANFNGFWYADETFKLPSNATNIKLSFSGLYGDDRIVLELNGTMIGNYALNGTNGAGNGVMSFLGPNDMHLPNPPDVNYTFTDAVSGTATTGFVVDGVNDLRLIVNNTGQEPITDPTRTFKGTDDTTEAFLDATLTYQVKSVPEPSSLLIGIVSASVAGYCGWRRRAAS
jgi:hypothetical protein